MPGPSDRVCLDCGESTTEASCPRCGTPVVARSALHPRMLGGLDPDTPSGIPDEVTRASDDPKKRFENYILIERIGQGGMGDVYRAWESEQRRFVALKILRETKEEFVSRFVREAHATTRLSHPNIVKVIRAGESEGRQFIAMEYIEGRTLAELLADEDRPDERDRVRLFLLIGRAIRHAHEKGVIHRDIKPGNILVDTNGHPFVVDFGLSRVTEPGWTVTVGQQAIGTPQFMSPEQVRGGESSRQPSTDIYSLGALLYTMLTGRPPVDGSTPYEIMERVARDEPVPPRRLNSRIHADIDTICMKCLEKQRDRRYGSVAELEEDVERWLDGRPILARPASWAYRLKRLVGRKKAVLFPIAAILMAALVFGVIELSRSQERAAHERLEQSLPVYEAAVRYLHNPDADRQEFLRRADKAQELIEAVLRDAPDFARAYDYLARIWEIKGWPDRAEANWRKAIARDDHYRPAHLNLGRHLLQVSFIAAMRVPGQDREPGIARAREVAKEAESEILRALELGLKDPAREKLARAMLTFLGDDYAALREICLASIREFPDDIEIEQFYWLLGLATTGRERMEAWNNAIRVRPNFALALYCRGQEYHDRRRREEAMSDLDRSIRIAPRFSPSRVTRALVFLTSGDSESAMQDFEGAIEVDPACVSAYNGRAVILTNQGRLEEALRDLDRALKYQPDNPLTHLNRAEVHVNREDWGEVIDACNNALRIRPSAAAYNKRGLARMNLGDDAKAIEDFTLAIGMDETYYRAYSGRAALYAKAGRVAEAGEDYSSVIRLLPEDAPARFHRGLYHFRFRKIREALEDFRTAIRLDPGMMEAHLYLGRIYQGGERFEEAREAFDRAVRIDPSNAEALFHRAQLLERMELKSAALADYRTALGAAKPGWRHLAETKARIAALK